MAENITEKDNFLRFVAFFVDIGTETVLEVFNYCQRKDPLIIIFPNCSKTVAKQLQKVLQKSQFYIVKSAQNADNFDLSILITLVSSLFSHILPMPVNGWGKTPAATDNSISADLLRLRSIRNKIVAHRNKTCLSSVEFEKFWKKVEDTLVRIYQHIDPGNEDVLKSLAEKIEKYRHKTIEASYAEKCFVDLKNQVTKVQNALQEFTHLLKTKQGPFFRYIKLLLKGGKCCLSAYLDKLVRKQNSILCRVLSDNRALLLKKLGDNQTMVNQIYPRENPMLINTETKNWDLYLLAIVITTVFGSSIKENKLSKVNAIRDSRRNYAYTALYAISNDQRFNHHREDLVTSLTVLSESIGGEVETECRRLIEEYRTTDPTDVDKYVNQLKVPGLGFKSINDVHRDFYKGLKAELETSVDINLKDNCELEIMIQLVCEDKDKQKKAEDSIDKFLTAILSGQPEASPDFPEVRKTIETINSIPSVKLTCVEKSCLLLTIEYQSKQALLSLINYVDSLEFQQHLDNISIEMASQFDEVFNLQGHFTIESLLRVLPNQEMEPFDIQTVPEKVHATQEENIYERRQKYSNVKPTAFSKVGTDRAIGERQPIESLLIDARRDALENKACYDVRSAELNAKRVQEDTISDSDHVKFALERNEQFELLVSANEKLQAENSELKRQKESLEDEKHNINKKKNRQIMKNESCQPLIKQQKIKIVRLMDEMDTKRKTTKQEVGKIDRRVKEKDTHLDKHEHSREDLQKRERRQNQTQENDVYRLIREKYRQGTELENEQERILHDYGIVKEKMQQNNEKLQLVSKKHLSALVRCEDAIKQVEFEKMLLDTEYNILAHSLCKVEEDNAILANAVQDLQAKLSKSKQEHAQRLTGLTNYHYVETEMDTDLLRQAQMQTKHLIGSLELAHRQTVKSMEETIATLKDQHAYWVSKRQQYIQRSARTGDEICDIRSLTAVDRDPCLDRKLLDIETRKIDDLSDVHSYPARTQIRRRSTMRTQSTHPPGFGAQSPFGRTGSRMSRRK